jgi:hypothetical protein
VLDLAATYPSFWDGRAAEKVVFNDGLSRAQRSYYQLTRLNWMDVFARRITTSYGDGRVVTRPQVEQAYADLFPAGVELRVFDPRAAGAAGRRAREIDLLTFAADGDGTNSVREIVELLAFMQSEKSSAHATHDELARVCPTRGQDHFLKPQIARPCYLDAYFRGYERHWATLPKLRAYYRGLDAAGRNEFRAAMVQAALIGGSYVPDPTLIDSPDSEALMLLFHYVETLFDLYDANRDNHIRDAEANAMYPVFQRELRVLADTDSNSLVRGALFFILAHGRRPNSNWEFMTWHAFNGADDVDADRTRILQIIGSL